MDTPSGNRPTRRTARSRRWRAGATAGLALLVAGFGSACAGSEREPQAGSSTVSATASATAADGSDASTAATPHAPHPVTTLLVTDDAAVSAAGPTASGTWPAQLAGLLAESGAPLELDVAAAADAGFAAGDDSFVDLVGAHIAPSTQLVVLYETEFAGAGAEEVRQGADAAFAAVEEGAPDAVIVVVAPWPSSPGGRPPGEEIRAAVRDAAAGAEVAVTYVDPVTEGWTTGASPEQIAGWLLPEVQPLAAGLARSGAFD
jgi:hypothetical protein